MLATMRLVISLWCLVGNALAIFQQEQFMSPIEIIIHNGYPAEEHKAVTDDGYILTLHRIPAGRGSTPSGVSKPAILIQHTLMSSSFDFLSPVPSKSLSYYLADMGYDVWLGNNRGNIYSTEHEEFHWPDRRFWNFSFDEMAQYDCPAMVDYILETTGRSQIYIAAHAQGSLTFFKGAAANANLNSKIKHFFSFAPVLSNSHMRGIFLTIGSALPKATQLATLPLPSEAFFMRIYFPICGSVLTLPLCIPVFADQSGSIAQLDLFRLPVFLSKFPGGTSKKNMLHWEQVMDDGVQYFDYGYFGNMAAYGTPYPRPYDFSNYSVPTSIYYSPTDHYAGTDDMKISLSLLPPASIVEQFNLTGYGHWDFLWGNRAKGEIYTGIYNKIASLEASG